MVPITIQQAAEVVQGRLFGNGSAPITEVSIDSRTLGKGSLFVALAGVQRDGHQFVSVAAERGSAAALVERRMEGTALPQIVVPVALPAFQSLAAWYRRQFDIPVVAVTGSNGKTMTKELVAHVLGGAFRVHKNFGNLNNELGVPLTLFGLESYHTAAVVEMGINHFGEMRRLAAMVQPTTALLTNIGPVHTEFLGDETGVATAKAELLEGMRSGQVIVVNGDEESVRPFVQRALEGGHRIVRAGVTEGCEIRIVDVTVGPQGTRCRISFRGESSFLTLPLFGVHQARNAALAAGVALELGVPFETVVERLGTFSTSMKGRFSVAGRGEVMFVDDSYNANPSSMRAALEVIAGWPCRGRRIAVLGDMFELGAERLAAHQAMGEAVARLKFDFFVAVGPFMRTAATRAETLMGAERVSACDSASTATERVKQLIQPGDLVLVKGSRAMHLEEVVERAVSVPAIS